MKPIPQQVESILQTAIQAAQAAGDLPAFEVPAMNISPPKRPEQGDYSTAVALASAKIAKQKPLDIATTIQKHMPDDPMLQSVDVAPPGFLNLRLSDVWLREQANVILTAGDAFFRQDVGAGKRAQVEFVSANPTGPLHVGRTRGAMIGDTVANILVACGWDVEREYYFNNAGRQMELLGKSLQARYREALGQDATLPDEGYQGDYLVTIAEQIKTEHGDTWQGKDWKPFKEYAENAIFDMIRQTLARVRIKHDVFFNEQSVYDDKSVWDTLDKLKEAGYVYESIAREGTSDEELAEMKDKKYEPATWFRSTDLGDYEDRVLVKSNGDPTYVLPDIAYHRNKLDRGFDLAVNVLGADHKIEAGTVAQGLQALGYDADKVHVILHQFVTFTEGRMSTRAGNYITLDDLIDEVGADVVRYFMIGRSHNSHYEFDFDLAKSQSNENPVYYIQNAHVRCCGILRQVEERGYADDWDADADLNLLGEDEMRFLRKVLELPEQLITAYEKFEPHRFAFWTLDLAREFHPMYDAVRVLHTEVPEDVAKARLRLYRVAKLSFRFALDIMGMSAPEKM